MQKGEFLKRMMTYGLIAATAYVAIALLLFALGINIYTDLDNSFSTSLPILALGFCLFFSIRHFENISEKKINFGNFLYYSLLIAIFAAIIISSYYTVFVLKLAPETIDFMFKLLEDLYKSWGIDIQQIDLLKELYKNPVVLYTSNFFSQVTNIMLLALMLAFFNFIFPKPQKKN